MVILLCRKLHTATAIKNNDKLKQLTSKTDLAGPPVSEGSCHVSLPRTSMSLSLINLFSVEIKYHIYKISFRDDQDI